MSWNNVIPTSVILAELKQIGAYQQLALFETPPEYHIDEKFLCDVSVDIEVRVNATGGKDMPLPKSSPHPAFGYLRDILHSQGYVKIEDDYHNGDLAIKEFFVNGVFFRVGDIFPSAAYFPKGEQRDKYKYRFSSGVFLNTPFPDSEEILPQTALLEDAELGADWEW